MSKLIIGIIGPGESALDINTEDAYEIGKLVGQCNFTLLTGGRNIGVMHAASKGAKQAGGITVGVLPEENRNNVSSYVDIPIITGQGSARNNINILTSDLIIAIGNGPGTLSEIALAMKANKTLIIFKPDEVAIEFFNRFSYKKIYFYHTYLEIEKHLETLTSMT